MISIDALRAIGEAKLEDAKVLFANDRVDGAAYLCGYTIELALKAQICRTLGWESYPQTAKDFENYQSFRTHKLDVLLHLSGQEERIKTEQLDEWSAIAKWNPEVRYKEVGQNNREEVELMLTSVTILLGAL
ncbi:MAG TPA: HEPN domain-containing protein [Thermoanaerobaculia bacterium]|nr:HEPN domain-containing protein [Thermoanaerobaculia bacterium]